MSICDFFHVENSNYLFGKASGQRISAILSVSNILIHEDYRKFDENCIKTLKIRNFFVFFLLFSGIFLSKNFFLSINNCWTTNSCLVEPFQHSKPRNLSKIRQKLHKNVKKSESFAVFSIFGVTFGSFCGPWGQLKKSRKLHKYKSHEAKLMWVEFYG